MSNEQSYEGSCFCGVVQFMVSGEPAGMGYCNCESCRSRSATPVIAFTLWNPDAVQITRGENSIASYGKTPQGHSKSWGHSKSCRTCGANIFTEHPGSGLIQVHATAIPTFPYRTAPHVRYGESKAHTKDGLPKMKDHPKVVAQNSAGRRKALDAPTPP